MRKDRAQTVLSVDCAGLLPHFSDLTQAFGEKFRVLSGAAWVNLSKDSRPQPSLYIERTMKTRVLCLAVLVIAGQWGCRDPQKKQFRPGRATYDTSPIAVDAFLTDAAVRRHILYMPFGEAGLRLGSLRYEASSEFVFSRGADVHEQRDVHRVSQDAEGNFHTYIDTPETQMEVYLLGDDLYVRYDRGQLRKKSRRQVETETWTELAFAGFHQVLELFRPRLRFSDATPEKAAGRQMIRYKVSLGEPEDAPLTVADIPASVLPVAPLPRWREIARPLHLTGSIWVDGETGVVLRSKLDGRLEVSDRGVRPTELRLRYDSIIRDIGKVAGIEVPESVPEFRREIPPRDLLGFFREHLPEPESEGEEATPTTP